MQSEGLIDNASPPRATAEETGGALALIRRASENVFGIDPRSAALFRIAIALVVLVDLSIRATALREHYTDAGIVPRDLLVEMYGSATPWSLHMLGGGAASAGLLFAIHAVLAALLLIGWRTRLMSVAVWVMTASLKARNPWITNAGDMLLILMLLWAIFVPLGAAWSVDAIHRRRRGLPADDPPSAAVAPILSFGTVGLILQLFVMYWVTGYWKMNEVWFSGQAMQRVASLDMYMTTFAHWLTSTGGAAGMLGLVSKITPWLEMGAPTLCLIPFGTRWIRLAAIVVMIGFHLGIEATIHTGMLQWVVIACWLVMLPGWFWDRVGAARWAVDRVAGWLRAPMGRAADALPPSGTSEATMRRMGVAGNVIAAALLVWSAAWYVQIIRLGEPSKAPTWRAAVGLIERDGDRPEPLAHSVDSAGVGSPDMPLGWIGDLTNLGTNWRMFARPMTRDGWYVIIGTLADGTTIDLLDDGEPFDPNAYSKPAVPASLFPNHRWRKYYVTMAEEGADRQRRPLAGVLCRKWNREHPDRPIEHIEIDFIEEPYTPTGDAKRRRLVFFRGPCPRPDDVKLTQPLDGSGF